MARRIDLGKSDKDSIRGSKKIFGWNLICHLAPLQISTLKGLLQTPPLLRGDSFGIVGTNSFLRHSRSSGSYTFSGLLGIACASPLMVAITRPVAEKGHISYLSLFKRRGEVLSDCEKTIRQRPFPRGSLRACGKVGLSFFDGVF
jgi:hypothetical protein